MNSLNALQSVIDDNLPLLSIQHPQRELWLEQGRLVPGSNKTDERGFHALDLEYRLVLAVDQLPRQHASLLALLVHQFVGTLDREGGLNPPDIEVHPNDERTADVEITVDVRDPVHLVEVQHSPIEFNGKKWGFGEGSLAIADQLGGVHVNG